MEINGKCKRSYTVTLDGEAFDLLNKCLGWAIYHKEDTIKKCKKEKHALAEANVSAHTKDWDEIKRLQDKLINL
jgi:hypothetical protein